MHAAPMESRARTGQPSELHRKIRGSLPFLLKVTARCACAPRAARVRVWHLAACRASVVSAFSLSPWIRPSVRSWHGQPHPEHVDTHRPIRVGPPDVALNGGRDALERKPVGQVRAEQRNELRHVAPERRRVAFKATHPKVDDSNPPPATNMPRYGSTRRAAGVEAQLRGEQPHVWS